MQMATCTLICLISMQSEIFSSNGYIKYVSQTDGSMDLLVKLNELKQKSFTYVYNNEKIQKIIYIQNRREVILATLEIVKKKLINWRK
jgi:hypothetical protein